MFESKIESYLFAIYYLQTLQQKRPFLSTYVEKIKIALENHEQDPTYIINILQEIAAQKDKLIAKERADLQLIIETCRVSNYEQTPEQKFENPLSRRFESEIAIIFLLNPTDLMMKAVSEVSLGILAVIDNLEEHLNYERLDLFAQHLVEANHPISFGSFKEEPSIETIKSLLSNNNPQDFIQILHIHYMFSLSLLREITITTAPQRVPCGKLLSIVQAFNQGQYQDQPENFFFTLGPKKTSYIPDKLFYESDLFTSGFNRGRLNPLKIKHTHQLGIMLKEQKSYNRKLGRHSSKWCADAQCQEADLTSPYVLDLINNDAVYISGPSGMTSLLLAQMEYLANFPTVPEKYHYLLAVTAYIVGGGFHSIDEVLKPAQYALDLVPGYHTTIPQVGILAPAPNYHVFFEQQLMVDPEFASRRDGAWQKLLIFFKETYIPSKIPLSSLTGQISEFNQTVKHARRHFSRQRVSARSPLFFTENTSTSQVNFDTIFSSNDQQSPTV